MDFFTYTNLCLLAFAQNVTFSMVSRSRNRDNIQYHITASILSNVVWFLTFRQLVTADMNLTLLLPYTLRTVLGSVAGVRISMWVESKIGAHSDSHIKHNAP